MSASMGQYQSEMEVSYAVDFGRDRESVQKRSRHPDYRRKGSAPARVNGMHCRRNKRWTWGSGRGARMTNLRAFAGCLALAVAGLASGALAAPVSFNFQTIGNPGNPGNTTSGTSGPSNPSGLGAVSGVFKLADKETTNAQYVAFLNAVDPNGTNPRGIYTASGPNGGIQLTGTAATGAKYSLKTGTPPSGTASSYGTMPVNFVSWFSAARFVNWLENGMQTGTSAAATMDFGVYTLGSATNGNVVARNAGTQYWLPSVDEWYKAAYYNGSSSQYTLYQTNSNATPTATVTNFALANAGNFATGPSSPGPGPVSVGSYTNASTSSYQLYDMLGNVAEITDRGLAGTFGTYRAMGGNYGSELAALDAKSAPAFNGTTAISPGIGFRVAAVPEPGTIALAGVGIAGLAGLDWMKRRKKRAAARSAA